jgi:DNA oxidative demethylase
MAGELPHGFILRPDFLTEGEEQALVESIRAIPFGSVTMRGVTAKRRVAQFGWRYSFETYKLTPAAPLPPQLAVIRDRAAAVANVEPSAFSEALVTEYLAGAGIGWHRDAPHFGIVAGISLGAECRMRFQRGEGKDRVTSAVVLPPRSIYLLTSEARTVWQHTIPAVRDTRWSVTFRTLRKSRTET